LNLTNETEEIEGLEVKNIPLEDDDDQELLPHLETAFQFIEKAAELASSTSQKKDKEETERATVLVHSYFGMSRSSAIIIAYLMKNKGWKLKDAYEHVKKRHSSVNPNDNFAVQLIRYEQELFDGTMSMTVKDFHQ
jgi:protein-tyrosine phosphatase